MWGYAATSIALVVAALFLVGRPPSRRVLRTDAVPIAVAAAVVVLIIIPATRYSAGVGMALLLYFLVIWGLLLAPVALVASLLHANISRAWLLGSAIVASVLSLPLIVVLAVFESCPKGICF